MSLKNQKCYFRTSSKNSHYKALVQITSKCNMKCKHCFVDSSTSGADLSYYNFLHYVLPLLKAKKTSKVTITGGEPTLNHDLVKIVTKLVESDIEVALCTNGLLVTEDLLICLTEINKSNKIHINVSLDSFTEIGYSNFRGINNVFTSIKKNIEMIAQYGYLKGILCTPNSFSTIEDYVKIAEFAKKIGGKYVLYNPIAKLGRGEDSFYKFGVSDKILSNIYYSTRNLKSDKFDITYVRFPLDTLLTNPNCIANSLMYIYVNGDVVRCPYISFTNNSKYDSNSFISTNNIANIYNDDLDITIDRLSNKIIKQFACEELEL